MKQDRISITRGFTTFTVRLKGRVDHFGSFTNTKSWCIYTNRRTPISAGNTFQDLPLLRETADNIESYTW